MSRVIVSVVVALLLTSSASADPPLPDAMRTKLEQIAPIQQPIVYVPAAGKVPARWIAFVGLGSAMSAWVVTPNAGKRELARIDQWPLAVRVVGVTLGVLPSGVPGNQGEPHAFVVAETIDAPELGQPAGIRSILPIGLPEPQYVSSVATHDENLPSFAGVKESREIAARLASASKFWDEETTDKLLTDDKRRATMLDAAKTSDAALAKLVPAAGIAVLETWQGGFAREAARIRTIDKSPAVQLLHTALAKATGCDWHRCGDVLVGAEDGHLVIRGVIDPKTATVARKPRRAVAANPKDTQTAATGRALAVTGTFRGEAPLGSGGSGGGTIGVVDGTVIQRDGAYATADEWNAADEALRFGDFDGDGLTDVALFSDRPRFVFGGARRDTSDVEAALELATLGKKTIDDVVAAAVALPDDSITDKDACTLLATTKTSAGLDRALAPHAEVFAFFEPSHPAQGNRTVLKGKRRLKELREAVGKCAVSCDPVLPLCVRHGDGPDSDYYLFTRIKNKLRLWRVALYRGA